ncbi:MAG: tetratricopeptide repeat protein [Candidatus Cloacimonetes bacterium]|nr:tetratricopeptide repeat protein [Candidatus Cloacimonadota bacterium]
MRRFITIFPMILGLIIINGCKSQYMRSGNLYLQQQEYEKAAEQYLLEIEENPDNIEAYKILGGIHYEQKEYPEAYSYYQICLHKIASGVNVSTSMKNDIIKLLESSWIRQFQKGQNEFQADRFDQALDSFEILLDMAPDSSKTLIMIGSIYRKQEKMDLAISTFSAAADLDPENIQILDQLAYLYYYIEDYEKAIKNYQEITELDPDQIDAWYNLAVLLAQENNKDEAAAAYQKLLEIDPENTDAHINLAILYNEQQLSALAADHFEKAFLLNPENTDILINLCLALNSAGRTEKLFEYAKIWHERKPESPDPLYLLINVTGEKKLNLPDLYNLYLKKLQELQ